MRRIGVAVDVRVRCRGGWFGLGGDMASRDRSAMIEAKDGVANDRRRHPSVVLIEDDIALRESLAEYLGSKGYQVEAAADGAEGLAKVEADTTAVVTDLKLPGLSGME